MASELPQHYGAKTLDGEIVRLPITPSIDLLSPQKTYHPGGSAGGYDEGISPADARISFDHDPPRSGLRRRPSNKPTGHRYSGGDYDRERPNLTFDNARRTRSRDGWGSRDDNRKGSSDPMGRDEFFRDAPPDTHNRRSRPPRSYRNFDALDRSPQSASKSYLDEPRGDYRYNLEREREDFATGRSKSRGENSIDGYNYDAYKRKAGLDINSLSKGQGPEVMRLPWTQWMNSSVKNHTVATIGEFVGTTMFLFFAFAGTQVANIQSSAVSSSSTEGVTAGDSTDFNISVYLYISIIFGFSLMVNVWVFFRISGGLFNPAVTLGMVLVKAIPIPRALCLFGAQIVGGIAASGMVYGIFPTEFNARTSLGAGTSLVQGTFIEAILTAELVFTIFMLAKEKHKATFIAPVGIGLALFIAEMVGVYYTGGSLNPARSLGPSIVTWTWDPEHWIYWVGPMLGSLIAVFFYKFIKMLEYEMANPGQDGDAANDPTKNIEKKIEMRQERGSILPV
ncbi:aquaporin-like protein [Calycina marina]|uniref:Aquaporin-like protein n=1 Tax=Calycina marina TaxID=1763456 RepID=A0A9P8CFH5_9HELO|nr:aquaporin-like protein [Calycina marina]